MAAPADRVQAPRMPGAPAYSAELAHALLDPANPAPDCVAGPAAKAAGKRFNVYRNNVASSLVDALASTFPATQRIVGETFFRAMALLHVRATPPASPLLFEYGRDFPAFIDAFEHTREMPWLGDVARIERAWLDAYHAADAIPVSADLLSRIAPELLGETRFRAHPATRVLRSRYPTVTIFSANRDNAPVVEIEAADPEDALVTRPGMDVIVRWLPPGGATFLSRLLDGATLGEAVTDATGGSADFDLAANIEGMISAGAFAGLVTPNAGGRSAKGD